MEAFYTVQGEGYFQGNAAYFIRLAGCDVGCHWCDVKDSWDTNKWPLVAVKDIVAEAKKYPSPIAVITGGEPLMHHLDHLCTELHLAGIRTNIETSGAYPLSGSWDWICLSPKKFKEALPEFFPVCQELKIIIYNKSDFEFAEKYRHLLIESGNTTAKLFLQPEWSKAKEMNPLVVDYVKANPCWNISLQIHKFLDIP
jgi:organic radical activating enzyme